MVDSGLQIRVRTIQAQAEKDRVKFVISNAAMWWLLGGRLGLKRVCCSMHWLSSLERNATEFETEFFTSGLR